MLCATGSNMAEVLSKRIFRPSRDRLRCTRCQSSKHSPSNATVDAKGLSYLGDSIWSVSQQLACVRRSVRALLVPSSCLNKYLVLAVLQLCVRRHFFAPPKHWRTYQSLVQPYVTAEGQVSALYCAVSAAWAGGYCIVQECSTVLEDCCRQPTQEDNVYMDDNSP
jgi:23S rRNA maturation mini-RNase III